ncbi:SGNH/GDSL hydrolase family protein [Kitasatospora sp. CM 4170]|uniref:SGNH/GDSL hydrolase family protein n=1 Tax=Kitasatospora aburaviensis TaxID=67265 RepID=A0ABW1ERZ5_9ACTN|nr:SGNH/GDSL hydrolase family protein [Kitasatospora sp. CM 4170]WNM45681.1 SGNH/GDSL hydrolase family protein [Kitasatospora sp. CM 4170]
MPVPARPTTTAVLSAALAALLLAGCTGGGSGGSAAPASDGPRPLRVTPTLTPTPTPTPAGPYVALGDSYTSGLKIAPQVGEPSGCARSAVNYPSLVAKALGLATGQFKDVSCSGARTGDLIGAQETAGGANPPQLEALTPATRLVTVGIGGNDAGFMEVVGACARENLVDAVKGLVGADRTEAPCREHYASAGGAADQVQRKVDAAGERLGRILTDIRQRSPQARVYVVGYPTLLPADPASCLPVLGSAVAPGDLGFLVEKEQQLNAMLKHRAEAAGAVFVDAAAPSAGHDMCAGEAARWVEPPFPAPGLAAIHPNAKGQEGVAAAVLKAVRG